MKGANAEMKVLFKYKIIFIIPLIILSILSLIKSLSIDSLNPVLSNTSVVELTDSYEVNEAGEYVWSYTLENEHWDNPIIALEHKLYSVKVTLADEIIYCVNSDKSDQGINVKWLYLPHERLGKQLKITSDSPNIKIFLGEDSDMMLKYCNENFGVFVFLVSFSIIAFIVLVVFFVLRNKSLQRFGNALPCLAIYIFLSAIWTVTDSTGARLMSDKSGVITLCSFMSIMMMPYFFIRFIKEFFYQHYRALSFFSVLYIANFAVCLILYLAEIVNLSKLIFVLHIFIAINLCFLLRILILELRKEHKKEFKWVVSGVVMLTVFLFITFILFYSTPITNYSILFAIGNFIFMINLLIGVIISTQRDILTSSKARIYRELAYFDMMTKLKSRTAFDEWINKHKFFTSAGGGCIVIDLNNLKKINDTYGHMQGDESIQFVAECIISTFEKNADCYRIGGDEFVVVMNGATETEIVKSMEKFKLNVLEKNKLRSIKVSVSSGYSYSKNKSVLEVYHEADLNMYADKRVRKNSST